jgi:hypothetical protein
MSDNLTESQMFENKTICHVYIYIFNIYYQLLIKHRRQDKSSFEIVSIEFDQSSF